MQAAATGTRPEKSVARSAPIRCMPMYQHTKPTTVTTAACHSGAAASAPPGRRNHPSPADSRPIAADPAAAWPPPASTCARRPTTHTRVPGEEAEEAEKAEEREKRGHVSSSVTPICRPRASGTAYG